MGKSMWTPADHCGCCVSNVFKEKYFVDGSIFKCMLDKVMFD